MDSTAEFAPRASLCLPPIPRTQALTSTTFRPPPLDGSLTIPELYDWHYEHSPEHPLFVYSDDNGNATTIKWPQAVRAVHRAGHIARRLAEENSLSSRPVFAILAGNDAITYFTLMAGIFRAGYTAFPVSPRNSPAAVAHLLTATSASHIFIGPEQALQTLAAEAFKIIDSTGNKVPTSSRVPLFDTLYANDSEEPFMRLPDLNFEWDDPLVILHSSGSTAFPKPLVYTHERLVLGCLAPWFGERDLTGQRLAAHSMPMFHGMGVMQIGWTAFSGLVLTLFKPQVPAVAPTPESVVKAAMDTKSDYIFCVPSFVEAWANNPKHVECLKSIEGIIYGGGPLSQAVGDELTREGVSIFAMYGNTECGINNVILPKSVGRDWQYFAFPANTKPYFIYNEDGNAELVLTHHQLQKPCILNTRVDGLDGYATSDIMTPHPTKPGYWKIFGRADDQIMHNTGEKTNPGPLENLLNQDPHVQAAIMFGRGRFNAGVLIEPKPAYKFDPADEAKLAEFRNAIWPTIEKLNAFAPQHSRLFKEMIIVASPNKPFTFTAKNTARRQAIIDDYASEIENLYATVEESAQADLRPPTIWDLPNVTPFMRAIVTRVLKRPLEDTDDIFLKGCDSLQATWIRNSVIHALKDGAKVNTRLVPNSFVYQYPNILALSSFAVNLITAGETAGSSAAQERVILQMRQLVEKYGSNFARHLPTELRPPPREDTIVLTGTTGGLGATILAELEDSPRIARIYALNRKASKPLIERHWHTFKDRGLDVQILDSPKIVLLEAEVDQENLGLPIDTFKEIQRTVTHIIHNAWPVNFNMALTSFEPNIRGVRRLIDLALSSPHLHPAHMLFVSSVGVLRNIHTTHPAVEEAVEAIVPVGSGYGESKWVSEQILSIAAESSSLRPCIVRIGQISGGESGAWSQAEWIPSMIRSSVKLNMLPLIDNEIALLPADAAARAIRDMRSSSELYLHLAHPHSVPWSVIMDPIAEELKLPLVPFDQWLSALEKSGEGLSAESEVEMTRDNPALKLLNFFAQGTGTVGMRGAFGIQALDVSIARKVSLTLNKLPPLTEDAPRSWIAYWRRTGFL